MAEGGHEGRDGEVPSEKKLSSYFEELFSSKVPRQKELSSSNEELSSSNEELFPNPACGDVRYYSADQKTWLKVA